MSKDNMRIRINCDGTKHRIHVYKDKDLICTLNRIIHDGYVRFRSKQYYATRYRSGVWSVTYRIDI